MVLDGLVDLVHRDVQEERDGLVHKVLRVSLDLLVLKEEVVQQVDLDLLVPRARQEALDGLVPRVELELLDLRDQLVQQVPQVSIKVITVIHVCKDKIISNPTHFEEYKNDTLSGM